MRVSAGAVVNPQFGNTFTDWFTIAKIPGLGAPNTLDNKRLADLIFQVSQPAIKLIRFQKRVHVSYRIRIDTVVKQFADRTCCNDALSAVLICP